MHIEYCVQQSIFELISSIKSAQMEEKWDLINKNGKISTRAE